jgi:DNA mismatch repair protein MSH4
VFPAQNIGFSKNGLVIDYQGLNGKLQIDHDTAINLEIISNKRNGKQHAGASLFGIFSPNTQVGARLLRANLLCPPSDLGTIKCRLDSVESLASQENGKVFFQLNQEHLKRFMDLDLLVGSLAYHHQTVTPKSIKISIKRLLGLKFTLELVPIVLDTLSEIDDPPPLLQEIAKVMVLTVNSDLRRKICEVITEDTTMHHSAAQHKEPECFAVKPGVDGMLDATRQSYIDACESVYSLCQQYQRDFQIEIEVQHTVSRGWFFLIRRDESTKSYPASLQSFPMQKTNETKKGITCTTQTLHSINRQIDDYFQELMVLTDNCCNELFASIREELSILHRLAHSVALLDLIVTFTDFHTSVDGCTRPKLGKSKSPFVLREARHPVVEKVFSHFVPVEAFYMDHINTEAIILTGPNCSGKSTTLQTVAAIAIMAHCGSFVPAAFANVPLLDRLFTRIGTSDDIESNASTFLCEMKETSYILNRCTPNSLILVDELGRGTSTDEGFAIAWTVCEHIMQRQSLVILATHFHQLCELPNLYPIAKNMHLRGIFGTRLISSSKTHFLRQLLRATDIFIRASACRIFPP